MPGCRYRRRDPNPRRRREPRRVLRSGASAPSRAATAYRRETSPRQFDRLILRQEGGVPQCLVDVLGLEIRIVSKDLIAGLACGEQPKQPCHREAESPDARLSGANTGVESYTREPHPTRLY